MESNHLEGHPHLSEMRLCLIQGDDTRGALPRKAAMPAAWGSDKGMTAGAKAARSAKRASRLQKVLFEFHCFNF